MTIGSLLRDAFSHHTWATLRILDACRALSDEQLAATVPGTYGSILDTLRHTVGADCAYLLRLAGGHEPIDEEGADLGSLRAEMERHEPAWRDLLASDIDPDEVVVAHRDDGSESRATRGIRLAQATHHGTDHRSQVCTALTSLGIEPPEIDVWAYAWESGQLTEIPAAT